MNEITHKEACLLDQKAQNIGFSSTVLMENAGRNMATLLASQLSIHDNILICCGKGNNGGDGCVVARYLSLLGFPNIEVLMVFDQESLTVDTATNLEILRSFPVSILESVSDILVGERLDAANVVVDAILGVGISRVVDGKLESLIQTINMKNKIVFALDIPSGFFYNDGALQGMCVTADRTITCLAPKTGMMDEKQVVGEIDVVDIGITVDYLFNGS